MVKTYKKIFPRIGIKYKFNLLPLLRLEWLLWLYLVDATSYTVSAISSQISADMNPHPSSVQKQLALALKKIEAYRKQIEHLHNQIDGSEVEKVFSKLKR